MKMNRIFEKTGQRPIVSPSTRVTLRNTRAGRVSCEIIISDMSGRVLKRIKTSGSKGTVRIYSSEIGAGLFIYSLVMDGQTVRSERMVSSNR